MDITIGDKARSAGGRHLLVPNINRSGRVLPAKVGDSPVAKLDAESPTRRLTDRELLPVSISMSEAEKKAHPRLYLSAIDKDGVTFLDQSGRALAAARSTDLAVDLTRLTAWATKGADLRLFVEARRFWCSPLLGNDPARDITLLVTDGDGLTLASRSLFDGAPLRAADVVMVGDDAAIERLFIADVGENGPSVSEVTAIASQLNVPLSIVPLEINRGDAWLQDQFQLAYSANGSTRQRSILHLPRMMHASDLEPGRANLRNFVDSHLPSDDIGVIKDFWELTISVSSTEETATLAVADTFVLYRRLGSFRTLLGRLLGLLTRSNPTLARSLHPKNAADLLAITAAIERARAALATTTGLTKEAQRFVSSIVPESLKSLNDTLEYRAAPVPTVTLTVIEAGKTKHLSFTAHSSAPLTEFYRGLDALHSPRSYGGNIEVSPSHTAARFGTTVTGSMPLAALQAFLTSRGRNPDVVSVYTDWLDVGHIDEILAFVGSGDSFELLRASPKLAVELLDAVVKRQDTGDLVTRLFRGKRWIHHASKTPGAIAFTPPSAYSRQVGRLSPYRMAGLTKKVDRSIVKPYGDSAYYDDRSYLVQSTNPTIAAEYSAAIPARDLVRTCRDTAEMADALFLADDYRYADEVRYQPIYEMDGFRSTVLEHRLDHVLAAAFPRRPVRHLPVLFDYVADFMNDSTIAVTPDLVNLQTVGTHLIVGRPHGPRMRPAEALAVVAPILERRVGIRSLPTEKELEARGLTRTWHWIRAGAAVYRATIGLHPSKFEEDFKNFALGWYDDVSLWEIEHARDPNQNHPAEETEDLRSIARVFRDGFDEMRNSPVDYCEGDTVDDRSRQEAAEKKLTIIADRIRASNPGVFGPKGDVLPTAWTRIEIPESTVDVFELYTQLVLENAGATVHFVDSWYYHTHSGGIHCGTNAIRTPQFPSGKQGTRST